MTTTTLRPNADTSSSGWTIVGGAGSIWSSLSDNSDATNVTSVSGAAAFVLEMGTVALPSGAVTKSLTVRLRWASSAGMGAQLYANPTTGGPNASVAISAAGATAANTQAGATQAIAYTQAQVDSLQFVYGTSLQMGTATLYEAYADLKYVIAAVTTVSYPTGSPVIAASSFTATWTSVVDTDADGSSRDRYRVKVFTAAQYGAGGFDPETSTAFYDSGVVLSTAQSQLITALANSTTYRVYVKVGDSVNGVEHFGAWTFAAFSTSFTTADILSVVGTPDDTNARISVVVTRVTAGPPPTWQTVEVQRSTDAGATWLPVRGATNVAVSGTTFTIVDYEAPNGTTVLYRARATYVTGANTVVGPWQTSASTSWTAAADWLKHPSHPSLNRQVTIAANPVRPRARRQGIHQVIGRSDPVVVSDVLSLPNSTVTFVTITDQDATDLAALLAYDVLFLQTRPGARFGQKYIAIGGVAETPVVDTFNESTTVWPIPWVEVLIPIDVGLS